MKNVWKIIFLQFLVLNISLVLNGQLVKDNTSPILVNIPSTITQAQKIEINFSFGSITQGLVYSQFIGLAFPSNNKIDLSFDILVNNAPIYACKLTDDSNRDYNIIAVASNNDETNVIYCQLNELKLETSSNIKYKLIITLNTVLTKVFFTNLSLFTSTSNSLNKLILDYLPSLGSIMLYGDYTNITDKPITIDATMSKALVYAYTQFDLTITLTVNSLIYNRETDIVFQYPSKMLRIDFPAEVQSSDTNASLNLSITNFNSITNTNTNSKKSFILNINSDFLFIQTKITFTIKNINVLDGQINITDNLELFLIYKNTYSIIFYDLIPIFRATRTSITLTIAHPEGWDIYANSGWPLKFTFQSDLSLINGGYVLIQHSNYNNLNNMFSFVAATCDFSESVISNGFQERPICFPLRTDFNYPANNKGSGVFFICL